MALFLLGMPCAVCKTPIVKGEQVGGFSAFLSNPKDPSYMFSDAVFHVRCFERHPLAARTRRIHAEVAEKLGSGHRHCVVCGVEITDPDDYFTTGFLTDDIDSPGYAVNYVQAHKSHLRRWKQFDDFERRIREFERSEIWGGGTIPRP